jgi:hypothetical protein
MFTIEELQERARRREVMQELKEINKESRNILEKIEKNESDLKAIEGRVKGFFKNGEFDRNQFKYYLFELGDRTMKDHFSGLSSVGIYDENTGHRLDGTKYAVKNLYVEYAISWCKKLQYDFANRKGANEELGHYQRSIRKSTKSLENRIGTGDRKRFIKLFPETLYGKKIDVERIAGVWKVSRTTAVGYLKQYTSKAFDNIIIESKDGRKKVYSFNPKYTFSGKGHKKGNYDVKVYVDFLVEVIKHVEEIEKDLAKELGVKELTHSALGTLHALIPYFHYETCYAVLNPTDSICLDGETVQEAMDREVEMNTPSPLQHLNITEISNIVAKGETDRKYIKRDLYVLQKAEAILYSGSNILINPKLMFAMSDEMNSELNPYIKTVLWQFKQEKAASKKNDKEKKEVMVKKKSNKKTKIEE